MAKNSASLKTTLIVFVSLIVASTTNAQITSGRQASFGASVVYQTWKITDSSGESKLTQFVAPLTGYIPLRDNLEMQFYIAGLTNNFDTDDDEFDLNGATDTRIQFNKSFNEDQFLISVGVNLPTGKRALNFDRDSPIINALSNNFINLPVRRFGQGFGFNALLGVASEFGAVNASAGVLFEFTGSYDPYQDLGDYNPGDIFSATIGADWRSGSGVLYGDMTGSIYTDDKFKSSGQQSEDASGELQKVFRQSPQIAIRVGNRYRFGNYRSDVTIRYLLRGRNRTYNPDETLRGQFQIFGDEFSAVASLRRSLFQDWYIQPLVDIRIVFANETEDNSTAFGKSYAVGIGGKWGRAINESLQLNFGAKYLTGNADDNRLDLTGLQLSAGVVVTAQ